MTSFVCSSFLNAGWSHNNRRCQSPQQHIFPKGPSCYSRNPASCRMRNKGGFHLPPKIPVSDDEYRRAIELLGCCTQRKRMRSNTAEELQMLVGQVPPNRLMAQQWKGSLERHLAKKRFTEDPNSFRNRNILLEHIVLPETRQASSRCFVLLEYIRRCYRTDRRVNPRVSEELNRTLGSCPTSCEDSRHYIRTLAYLNRKRRVEERLPSRMPLESDEKMQKAIMYLGVLASNRSIGAQVATLKELIGCYPRDKNTALYWKKGLASALRRKRRKDRVAKDRIEADAKRQHRRMKKLDRLHQLERAAQYCEISDTVPSLQLKSSIEQVAAVSYASGDGIETLGKETYLERLYAMMGKIFSWKH